MRYAFLLFLALAALAGRAQTATPMTIRPNTLNHLEDLKETMKHVAVTKDKGRKQPAEINPELNRNLVIAADDFVRVTLLAQPTQEAYLACIDKGLARVAPIATTPDLRQQVADYYLDLMEIVGLPNSAGKLDAFVGQVAGK